MKHLDFMPDVAPEEYTERIAAESDQLAQDRKALHARYPKRPKKSARKAAK